MTNEQWTNFLTFFASSYPELDSKLPARSLVNGQPFITQPAKVTNEEYAEYNNILDKWAEENNAI